MDNSKTNIAEEPTMGYNRSDYTYADYLKFTFDEAVEIIRGQIFKMSPAPKSYHQQISSRLFLPLGNFFVNKNCELFHAPFDVVLPVKNQKKNTSTTVVQPDLCIICDLDKIDEAGCTGAPDLIIEILSDSTSKKDLNDKYSIYEECGVKEYWIVMPKQQLVEIFSLQNGKYQRIKTYTKDEAVQSLVFPELSIGLEKVF